MVEQQKNNNKRLVYLQYWCLTVSIPAFQAGGTGSNPVYCSTKKTVTSVVVAPRIAIGSLIGALQQTMTNRLTKKEMGFLFDMAVWSRG